jgi:DNA-binding response OmpR family regulator
MDGFQLLQWLKQQSSWRHTPVVMLSSSTMQEDIARAYEFGAAAYLVKPNTLEELHEQMKALVQFWSLSQTSPRTIAPVRAAPL